MGTYNGAPWGAKVFPVSFLNRRELPAQPELGNEGAVAAYIFPAEVIEEATATTHHLQQAPPGRVVPAEALQVLGQIGDALREHRNLDLR